ncbi:MAG: VOC family protein [Pirellulales bacterium]|nr:VOC family protein [Pirellulales bacterium]
MAVKPIPDGYHTVTPYLIVSGVPKLLAFMKQAFDAQEMSLTRHPDGSVMHADMKVGDSRIMIGEARDEWPPLPAMIYLYVPDTDATYQKAIAAGAETVMEPADQFYGDRNAGVKDPTGILWWIGTHQEDVSEEEMSRRIKAMSQQQNK